GGEAAELLASPNNLLGIEYINAAASTAPEMEITTVKRVGAGHGEGESDGFASAGFIRELARAGKPYAHLLPDGTEYTSPVSDPEAADRTLLHLLRGMSAEDIAAIDGVTEGLENRIVKAAAEAERFSDVAALVKSKRYTLARIRRLLLRCLIGIKRGLPALPPYVRVLGLNARGAAALNAVKKTVPILTKPADCDKLDAEGQTVFAYELKAAELYALTLPPAPAGAEMRYTPVVIK
ncbi:MAG: nucleotidyltransferase family protein, partial [Clostridia bacterium]|nr:nucleotidyltransferase family protein [Clostridia bacterium]